MRTNWFAVKSVIVTSTISLLVLFFGIDRASSHVFLLSGAAAPAETPTVNGVEPSTAPNDIDSPITIVGTGFTADLSGTLVITPPTVRLDNTVLSAVGWVSSTQLTATVPWGLDAGVYTVTVVNPTGEANSLPNAFTVTQGIGVWTTAGPYGGTIYTLALGESQYDTLYATVINVGLFRSRNSGASWELIFNEIGWENAVTVDPANPNRLYIAKRSKGLYRSENGGDTWAALPLPIPNNPPYRLRAFVNPHDGTLLGALSSGSYNLTCDRGCGLFKYNEAGQTWQRLQTTGVLTEETAVTSVGFDPIDSQIIYAGRRDGVVVTSIDGGQIWASLGQTPLSYISKLFVNPISDHEPWVCGTADGQNGGLYKYRGGNWEVVDGPGVSDLVFDPAATNVASQTMWIAADQGVLQSQDGGQNWSNLSPGYGGVMAIALNPANPQVIYSGRYGDGVRVTRDGGASWQTVNQGLSGIVPAWLGVDPLDPMIVYAVADSTGIFGSRNGGEAWEQLTQSWHGPIVVDPTNPQHVVAGNGDEVLVADDGWNFNRSAPVPLPPGMNALFYTPGVNAMATRPGLWLMGAGYLDTRLPYYNQEGGGGIYTSSDGENWIWVSPVQTYPVTTVGFDPVDTNIFYAATSGGGPAGSGAKFLKSTDSGQTWQLSANGLPPDYMSWDTHMAIEPTLPYRIFLVNGGGLYVSSDQGGTWSEANRPSEFNSDTSFNSIVFSQGSPSILYAASTIGLFKSMDGAQTWQRAQGALGQLEIWALATGSTPGRQFLYATTVGGMTTTSQARTMHLAGNNETLVSAGVYRYTTLQLIQHTYLPLLRR